MLISKLKVMYQAPSALLVNPDNAKRHPAKQVAQVKRSLQQFGFLVPVLVNAEGMKPRRIAKRSMPRRRGAQSH